MSFYALAAGMSGQRLGSTFASRSMNRVAGGAMIGAAATTAAR